MARQHHSNNPAFSQEPDRQIIRAQKKAAIEKGKALVCDGAIERIPSDLGCHPEHKWSKQISRKKASAGNWSRKSGGRGQIRFLGQPSGRVSNFEQSRPENFFILDWGFRLGLLATVSTPESQMKIRPHTSSFCDASLRRCRSNLATATKESTWLLYC